MVLDVKSVDRLVGTPVPHAYPVKAGPWIFLTAADLPVAAPFLHPTRACARRRDGREPRQN
jgi:hypothetical protein